jgi:hypothetical protein
MLQFMVVAVHAKRVSAFALAVLLFSVAAVAGDAPKVNAGPDRIAIRGYDPVAYFTDGQAVKGSEEFEYEWLDVRWRFASLKHRNLFTENPEHYAPQYGGFCSGAMAFGDTVVGNPNAWAIVDGKLYLNYAGPDGTDMSGRDDFLKNSDAEIAKADANWAKLHPNAP